MQLPQSNAKLLVDTAASGLYISRTLAEQNNLHQDVGAPEGTVHVDDVHIGPLEFRDCTVGVSDTPFPDKTDGIIGTDIFASYLMTLDFRLKRLTLELLPPQPGLLPGDRSVAPELKDFVPVYHRRQYLLASGYARQQVAEIICPGLRHALHRHDFRGSAFRLQSQNEFYKLGADRFWCQRGVLSRQSSICSWRTCR